MSIKNKKVAILATDGFEESELSSPKKALEEAGATAVIVSPKSGSIKSWKGTDWSKEYQVDMTLSEANADDFDALVLPGGVINPDQLRKDDKAISFVKSFFNGKTQRPVASICHGPLTLINADVVRGRRMTSYDSIRKDLENAGAKWMDEEVVCDQGLVTSRNPNDLDAFNSKLIEEIDEGRHKIV
ncbi:MAG: protease [Halobacteriovoraceae bacterium]|jgi:protease I|nr:protease [Halobacteriovoraceae bacterium]MBC97014.1 protease [Halobacteriovoraceae bacterium]|tara:strand:- start:33896 stop:34453 length:558 start_codon:yes stop_codon:yes gene_type:complete